MSIFEEFQKDALSTAAVEGMFISTKNSRERKISEYREIEKTIDGFIQMLTTWVELIDSTEKRISATSNDKKDELIGIVQEFTDKFTLARTRRADAVDGKKLTRAYMRMGKRYKDRADLNKPEVQEVERALYEKCRIGGEFNKRLVDLSTRFDKVVKFHNTLWDKCVSDGLGNKREALNVTGKALHAAQDEINYTIDDTRGVQISIGKGADYSKLDPSSN